jgi:hypothetical protein
MSRGGEAARRAGAALMAAGAILASVGPWAAAARAQSSVVLPRPGQVGLSVGGGYGMLTRSGNVGEVFDAGPTFTVRLRYRMRYERGIGLSFESQMMDVRVAPPEFRVGDESTVAPRELSLIASGLEFYQMFGTRTRTTRMLIVGAGLAQLRAELNTGETELSGSHSGDGLYVSAGAGLERFFFRSWAWDLSGRYLAVFREGRANHDLQVALGVIFYAGY